NAARSVLGLPLVSLPVTTMVGALFGFISSAEPKHFQPMPPNFGIFPALPTRIRNKRERYGKYRDRSFADLQTWADTQQITLKKPQLVTA
ncbi:MAG: methylenetetrahydrofolate--tRNA-(uracil(54)-C(5))-methyltransferase (FADH(2)-oxidizing) TrmFO, partial [Cyanobacteria bacterium J06642_11]